MKNKKKRENFLQLIDITCDKAADYRIFSLKISSIFVIYPGEMTRLLRVNTLPESIVSPEFIMKA